MRSAAGGELHRHLVLGGNRSWAGFVPLPGTNPALIRIPPSRGRAPDLELLARDCRNICAWFLRRGIDNADPDDLCELILAARPDRQ